MQCGEYDALVPYTLAVVMNAVVITTDVNDRAVKLRHAVSLFRLVPVEPLKSPVPARRGP
jgi:hypothetical protein